MLDKFNLLNLPSVKLSEKDRLPTTAGIYFALDSNNQLWYVGKARNINKRWVNHHRYHQLEKVNKKTPILLRWYECENDENILTQLEDSNYLSERIDAAPKWFKAHKVTVKILEGDSYRSISAPVSAANHAELEQRLNRIKQLSPLHQKIKFER